MIEELPPSLDRFMEPDEIRRLPPADRRRRSDVILARKIKVCVDVAKGDAEPPPYLPWNRKSLRGWRDDKLGVYPSSDRQADHPKGRNRHLMVEFEDARRTNARLRQPKFPGLAVRLKAAEEKVLDLDRQVVELVRRLRSTAPPPDEVRR